MMIVDFQIHSEKLTLDYKDLKEVRRELILPHVGLVCFPWKEQGKVKG
jgi:hypothetical protein